MTKYQQEYGTRGFQAIDLAINAMDEGRKPDQASLLTETFANNFQVGFPVGYIGRDPMDELYGVQRGGSHGGSQLVLIDRKGFIRYQTPAGDSDEYGKLMNPNTVRQHIEELLAQPVTAAGRHAAAKKAI